MISRIIPMVLVLSQLPSSGALRMMQRGEKKQVPETQGWVPAMNANPPFRSGIKDNMDLGFDPILEDQISAAGFTPELLKKMKEKADAANPQKKKDEVVVQVKDGNHASAIEDEIFASGFLSSEKSKPKKSLEVVTRSLQKIFMWHHITNAGGSLMCHLAQQQGEVLYNPNVNCAAAPFDVAAMKEESSKVWFNKYSTSFNSKGKVERFREQHVSWSQIERGWHGKYDANHHAFTYGTMVREPMALLKSVMKFDHIDHDTLSACIKIGDPICLQSMNGGVKFDNFATRVLSGCYCEWCGRADECRIGMITEDHLKAAKSAIDERYGIVVALEKLNENYNTVAAILDWDPKIKPGMTSEANTTSLLERPRRGPPTMAKPQEFTEAETKTLLDWNKFDVELYNYVMSKGGFIVNKTRLAR